MPGERFTAEATLPIHRHQQPYAALILEGGYEEFGPDGRWACEPGDLIIHPAYHLHGNKFGKRQTRVLNVSLNSDLAGTFDVRSIADPDRLLFAADKQFLTVDLGEALAEMLPVGRSKGPTVPPEWLGDVATLLAARDPMTMPTIAQLIGRSREHISRTFHAWFGVTPTQFRAEHRLRRARTALAPRRLASVAVDAGFYDQAHMCRAFRNTFDRTPADMIET